jgi:hypothetical protein
MRENMSSLELLIGADPELFFKRDGVNISAHTLLPGSKVAPYPVPFGAVQVDGTAGEFNIDPASTEDEFVLHISEVMKSLEQMIDADIKLDISPVVEYPAEYWNKLPGFVKKLGCDPDYNAYTKDANPKPKEEDSLRTAAGHLHVGWGKDFNPFEYDHFETCCLLGIQLDYWVGLVSTILDPDTKRKQKYGKAGALRPKPYGMEYRVPSNWWLQSEGYMRLIYSNAKSAFSTMQSGTVLFQDHGEAARKIIDSNDTDAAVELCNKLGIPFWTLD